MDKLFLKQGEEDRILRGHPWIFDNEIGHFQGDCPDGNSVEVFSKSGLFLGIGVINRHSRISVRLFSRTRGEKIDKSFFVSRIRDACEHRLRVYGPDASWRLLFAEADYIPGLIVDRFIDCAGRVWLVAQFLTLGVDVFRKEIIEALVEVCSPVGIYERSDVHVRALEGLEETVGWIYGSGNPVIEIRENGLIIRVDMACGQKTGYFLDQKDNRACVARIARGMRVLDTFAHTGAFGLNAAFGGAREVTCIDISADAVATVRHNIEGNRFSQTMQAVQADVFEQLRVYEKEGQRFDMIILDPPAFTKSAKMAEKAYGGYKEINVRAMKLLVRGGYLVTCSCSHFFPTEMFYKMIHAAAGDAKRTFQILARSGASGDHPALGGYPESDYLKCAFLRIW